MVKLQKEAMDSNDMHDELWCQEGGRMLRLEKDPTRPRLILLEAVMDAQMPTELTVWKGTLVPHLVKRLINFCQNKSKSPTAATVAAVDDLLKLITKLVSSDDYTLQICLSFDADWSLTLSHSYMGKCIEETHTFSSGLTEGLTTLLEKVNKEKE